jgi:hypothetical protein
MWKELGGDTVGKVPEKKKVQVETSHREREQIKGKQAALA